MAWGEEGRRGVVFEGGETEVLWLKIRIQEGEDKTARERKTRLSQSQSGDGRRERH